MGTLAPRAAYFSGDLRKSTTSRSSSFAPSTPATSANVTLLFCAATGLRPRRKKSNMPPPPLLPSSERRTLRRAKNSAVKGRMRNGAAITTMRSVRQMLESASSAPATASNSASECAVLTSTPQARLKSSSCVASAGYSSAATTPGSAPLRSRAATLEPSRANKRLSTRPE